MPTYKIMGERTLIEAWTYLVKADDENEALEMVENCPDGECDGIIRLQDDKCYSDDTEFSILEEVREKKPQAKKAASKKKAAKKKSTPKKKKDVRKKSR